MKNFLSILFIFLMIISLSSCMQLNKNDLTQYNISSETVSSTEENTEEILIPTTDNLNDIQKSLLPFYNNGYILTRGDRDLYYLGELIASDIPIYVDDYSGNYLWTITDEKIVYFRGEVGYEVDGKWLMTYDVKKGETNKIRDWEDLEKYGDSIYFTSDGKNVFVLFRASEWYNVVQVDNNGNDTLLSKIDFYNSFNSEEGHSEIEFLDTMQTDNEYEFYIYGTIRKDDTDDYYYRKYKIDFRTGKYNCVDEIISPENDGGFVFLPIPMCFLPNNVYYYGKEVEVSDELTGYKHIETEIYIVNRNDDSTKLLGRINDGAIDEATYDPVYLTDKYLVFAEVALDLSTGDVLDKNMINDSFYYMI